MDEAKKDNDIRECDCCGRVKPVNVASSTLGAISFAYCSECNVMNAEPKGMITGAIESVGIEHIAEWVFDLTYFDDETKKYVRVRKLKDKP